MFLKRTKSGTLIRAGIQDREMVQVLGFNIGRTFTLTYALGTAIAGIAGLATAPLLGVYPEMGYEVLILGFVVVVVGGLGSAVIEYMNDNSYKAKVIRLGIPVKFVDHGTQEELYKECGFDANGIASAARNLVVSKILTRAM